ALARRATDALGARVRLGLWVLDGSRYRVGAERRSHGLVTKMREHDCDTVRDAHLVLVRWAFGPSSLSLRASPSSPTANRAPRDGQRPAIFSAVSSCSARRSPKARPGEARREATRGTAVPT